MADLVSSQVLQKTLDELRNITRIDLCVTNTDGVLLVTTFPETAIDAESIIKSSSQKHVRKMPEMAERGMDKIS